MPPRAALNRLAFFAAAMEAGSFTAAAARLGVTKSLISQQVARLEQELRVTLFARTSRRLAPTEAGLALHARCAPALAEAEAALAEVADGAGPTGTLRIAAPLDYGAGVVAPAVARFIARHPDCRVELRLDDAVTDLLGGRFDLAIRTGWLRGAPGSFATRRLGGFGQRLVCAADRAAEAAALRMPADLAARPWVAHAGLREPLRWRFRRLGRAGSTTVTVTPAVAVDTTPAVRALVLAGAGYSVLPDFAVAEDLAAGRLRHVLPGWALPEGGIHALLPPARFRPAKVRLFLELLAEVRPSDR